MSGPQPTHSQAWMNTNLEEATLFKALYKIALQHITVHLPAASDLTDAVQKEARDLQEALDSIENAQLILFKMQHKEDMNPMHWSPMRILRWSNTSTS